MSRIFRLVGRDLDEDGPSGPGEQDKILRRPEDKRIERLE